MCQGKRRTQKKRNFDKKIKVPPVPVTRARLENRERKFVHVSDTNGSHILVDSEREAETYRNTHIVAPNSQSLFGVLDVLSSSESEERGVGFRSGLDTFFVSTSSKTRRAHRCVKDNEVSGPGVSRPEDSRRHGEVVIASVQHQQEAEM